MNAVLQELGAQGCDIRQALHRMLDDEDFYLTMLEELPHEPSFAALGRDLAAGDTAAAFDSAHTLKGVLGNLGLTPLCDTVNRIVEPLRTGSTDGVQKDYAILVEQRCRLAELLHKTAQ